MFRYANFKRIPIWEVNRRLVLLRSYRGQLQAYFAARRLTTTGRLHETAESTDLRAGLNRGLSEADRVMALAGIPAVVGYQSPAAQIGPMPLPLLPNFSRLYEYKIGSDMLFDHIDRAIGVYEDEQSGAQRRTLNPLFWLGLLIDFVVSLPLKLLRRAGFEEVAENSRAGKIARLIGWGIAVLSIAASVIQILQAFGQWPWVLHLIGWPRG